MPFFSKVPNLPYEPPDSISIADFVFDDKHRDRSLEKSGSPFTCGLSGKTYGVQVVKERVDLLARGLSKELGWLPNEGTEWDKVVGVFSFNTIDYLPVSWAVHRLSGITSLSSAAYTTPELVHQLKLSGCKALFTCVPLLKTALEAADICNIPRKNVYIFELPKEVNGPAPPEFLTVDDLINIGSECPELEKLRWTKGQGKRQTAFLCFSSGTSGLPKGVMCSHYNVISNLIQATTHNTHRSHQPPYTVLALLPQSHIYSLVYVCHCELLYGNTAIILPSYNLSNLLSTIQKYRIKAMCIVPPIVIAFLNNTSVVEKYDLSSIEEVVSAAAPLAAETILKLTELHPTWGVRQAFGMTESCVAVSTTLPSDPWPGSCGELVPGYAAKLIDPSGHEITEYNKPGELVLKSPSVVSGYLNNQKATSETFREGGWLWTGDEAVFRKSEKGNEHLFIVDRIKELIKVKGTQVAPAELEAHLLTHPLIADCAVIPLPDPYSGEVPKAFVVLKPNVSPSPQLATEIIKFVEVAKARHKRLKGGVEFIDVIPKSPSGKILKRVLREREKVKEREVRAKL